MTTATVAVLSVSLLLAPAPQLDDAETVVGAVEDGTQFLRVCSPALRGERGVLTAAAVTMCLAYVRGVALGWNAASDVVEQEMLPAISLPENVTQGQMLRVVLKYLDDHPEELHQALSGLVVTALLEAFGDEPGQGDDGP